MEKEGSRKELSPVVFEKLKEQMEKALRGIESRLVKPAEVEKMLLAFQEMIDWDYRLRPLFLDRIQLYLLESMYLYAIAEKYKLFFQ